MYSLFITLFLTAFVILTAKAEPYIQVISPLQLNADIETCAWEVYHHNALNFPEEMVLADTMRMFVKYYDICKCGIITFYSTFSEVQIEESKKTPQNKLLQPIAEACRNKIENAKTQTGKE